MQRDPGTEEVEIAEPFNQERLSGRFNLVHMVVRQFNYPHMYSKLDSSRSTDLDRLHEFDHDHASECMRKHVGSGPLSMNGWIQGASDEEIMSFLKEILKADPNINWTGYRILATSHRMNGQVIYSLQLFAKHPNSETKVYTGYRAPNIHNGGRNPNRRPNMMYNKFCPMDDEDFE